MAEYVKREYAVDAVLDVYCDTPDIDLSCEKFEAAIRKIQAADVAPVRHGEWILGNVEPGYFTPGGNRPWICSKCKQVVSWSLARPEYNYCHNCGARMDGDTDA